MFLDFPNLYCLMTQFRIYPDTLNHKFFIVLVVKIIFAREWKTPSKSFILPKTKMSLIMMHDKLASIIRINRITFRESGIPGSNMLTLISLPVFSMPYTYNPSLQKMVAITSSSTISSTPQVGTDIFSKDKIKTNIVLSLKC